MVKKELFCLLQGIVPFPDMVAQSVKGSDRLSYKCTHLL